MIRYHGTPITPAAAAQHILKGRHALVSYFRPDQIGLAAEVCQSFVIDNGAFSYWKKGIASDWSGFEQFCRAWEYHPGFDWLLIPDVIDGTLAENKKLIEQWEGKFPKSKMVPVWHLNETIDWLVELSKHFDRIAIGSAGEFSQIGTDRWFDRMNDCFDAITDNQGRPQVQIHGLRMMNPTLFSRFPFASCDSCNIARNCGIDKQWEKNPYMSSVPRSSRGVVMADRCEGHAAASVWVPNREKQYRLLMG